MQTSERNEHQRERRVFVPLAKDPFRWFEDGLKEWELRKYGRQYTERHVKPGEQVELRYGYSSDRSLWGVVTKTITAKSIRDFFAQVDYGMVIPSANSIEDAIRIAEQILNIPENADVTVFAFRVELRK